MENVHTSNFDALVCFNDPYSAQLNDATPNTTTAINPFHTVQNVVIFFTVGSKLHIF